MTTNNNRGVTDANYTSVTFDEIKERLLTHAKSRYPDTYRDFNASSFGSMMFDLVAMMSEQLNFYANYVGNESYVQSAYTMSALEKLGSENGVDVSNAITSYGTVSIYTAIPADAVLGTIDSSYTHRILKGAVFTTPSGGRYTSTQDAVVDLGSTNIIGTTFSDDDSRITYFVYKVDVPVVSGEERTTTLNIGTYRKFLKFEISDLTLSNIIDVEDSNGNKYYETSNLAQNVIYKELPSRDNNDPTVPSKLVPMPVPRRFTKEINNGLTSLVYGFGSEDDLKVKNVANPNKIATQQPGKEYVTDNVFDPAQLQSTDKFGVAPQNTTLTIKYRSNTTENSNAPVNSINGISSAQIIFENENNLDADKVAFIRNNIAVTNSEPINGTLKFNTTQEISQRIKASLGSQSRAVTLQDYVASAYSMPASFGALTRASISRDTNDLKRNLNMYVISQDVDGNLQQASAPLKNNLKTWLNSVRMVTDTLDIFDAKIVNVGLEIDIVVDQRTNFSTVLSEVREKLFDELTLVRPEIGQHFSVGDVEKILSKIPYVVRFNSVKVVSKSGTGYSDIRYDIATNISPDGGLVYIPEDCIWEIKNASDITGKVQ
jgi:hypothetical protein